MSDGNAQGRASHERGNGRERDEVDDEAKTKDAEDEYEGATEHSQGRCDNRSGNFRMFGLYFKDDVANEGGHDCDGANSNTEVEKEGKTLKVYSEEKSEHTPWK